MHWTTMFYKNGGRSVIAVSYMIGLDRGQSDVVLFFCRPLRARPGGKPCKEGPNFYSGVLGCCGIGSLEVTHHQ